MDDAVDSGTDGTATVEGALAALSEGRLGDFRAVDDEMGLAVSVVARDLDRYMVRRGPMAGRGREGEETVREEWRSHAWVATMLRQGHWRPVPPLG